MNELPVADATKEYKLKLIPRSLVTVSPYQLLTDSQEVARIARADRLPRQFI